jgi:hypothetical protein
MHFERTAATIARLTMSSEERDSLAKTAGNNPWLQKGLEIFEDE